MNVARHGRELGQRRVQRHRLNIAGGGTPMPPVAPDCTTPAVLAVINHNTLSYTRGVWTGHPAPTVTAVLNVVGGPSGIVVVPGNITVDDAWRGKNASILESGVNGVDPGFQQVSNTVAVPAAADLDAEIEAMLAGTTGCVFDPQDLSTLSQSHNSDVPVTAQGDQIGRMRSKYGTTVRNMIQSTAAARGLWQSDGTILFDGVDDNLTSGLNIQNVPEVTVASWCKPSAAGLTGDDALLFSQVAGTGSTNERVLLRLANGVPTLTCRRLDADAVTTVPGTVTLAVDTAHVIIGQMDFAGASPLAQLFVDGVSVNDEPISGTPGNIESTASGRSGYGTRHTTMRFGGKLGRAFYAPFVLTPEQFAIVEAWLEEPI
jgi:hypothetical protein